MDAQPIIGDGAVMETYGLGAFTLANSPAIMSFIGGTVSEARELTVSMYGITAGESSTYTLPALSMKGVPTGIDVEQTVAHRLPPYLHVEIMHKLPGGGPIGVALWQPPLEPFERAAADMR